MRKHRLIGIVLLISILKAAALPATDDLARGFVSPPDASKPWIYWWWLHGYVTKDAIVRDLDEMKRQGISGALVFQAGGGPTPKQTDFMSPEWREFFRFAVEEAAKRNIEISLNVCDGWNAGGPWVKPEDAAQTLVHATVRARGPTHYSKPVPEPQNPGKHYNDIAVLAYRLDPSVNHQHEDVCRSDSWLDISAKLAKDGQLVWDVPEGDWLVIRFGEAIHSRVHTKCTSGPRNRPRYLEIDPLRAAPMDKHFAATVVPLLKDVGALAGKTFKYLHIDSGEIGEPNWTPAFRAEFQRRRGYDPFPYLAAMAGQVVDRKEITSRFLEDYDRTLGDLMVECYYGRLGELAHKHGLGTHSEAAGFQKPCVDALRSLGGNDICMSEYWVRGAENGTNDNSNQLKADQLRVHDGIKTASSAAHAYGRDIVQAEAYTVIRDKGFPTNWDRDFFALKDIGDRAFCQGLNRNMLCFYILQPEEDAKPGYTWPGVGMEFDRHVTWWPLSHAWLKYLARCQYVFQTGEFVADVCYFSGEWAPSYIPAKWAMKPALPPGWDCDTVNAEALLARGRAVDGGVLTVGNQPYRYLVLWQGGRWKKMSIAEVFGEVKKPLQDGEVKPQSMAMSPDVLAKIKVLVEGGVTLIGPRPVRSYGLTEHQNRDEQVRQLADAMWGPESAPAGVRRIGKGRVIWGMTLAEVAKGDGLQPDLEIREDAATTALPASTLSGIPNPGTFDWIHYRIGDADAYFVANLRNAKTAGEFVFRIANKQPELWDAVTGESRDLPIFQQRERQTHVALQFEPRQSYFIVFRQISPAAAPAAQTVGSNFRDLKQVAEIAGPWQVRFDHDWGAPKLTTFTQLEDWTKRPEPGIKYYSGKATYENAFDLPSALLARSAPLYLDLGKVKNVAEVRLNGENLGVVWTAPWHVRIDGHLKPLGNRLEIDVVNLWPNRLLGDAPLPPEKRLTKTNVEYRDTPPAGGAKYKPLESGLLGPVTLQVPE